MRRDAETAIAVAGVSLSTPPRKPLDPPVLPAMGRRALRKIDAKIDLSAHLKTLEQLPRPWDTGTVRSARGVAGRGGLGQGTILAS